MACSKCGTEEPGVGVQLVTMLLVSPLLIPLVMLGAFYNAWAATTLWRWFLAEKFGVLAFEHWLGIFLLAALIRPYRSRKGEEKAVLVYELLTPLLFVVVGRVVLWWLGA